MMDSRDDREGEEGGSYGFMGTEGQSYEMKSPCGQMVVMAAQQCRGI